MGIVSVIYRSRSESADSLLLRYAIFESKTQADLRVGRSLRLFVI
jgi:hypothetical protein